MLELNDQQKQAAEFYQGTAMVIAVPGSGKTLTMTHRIGNLVEKYNVPPEQILGMTFTRNAANAMRERLKPLLNKKAKRVLLTTIHSFCFYLLKREGYSFELLTGHDQASLLKSIINDLKLKNLTVGMVLREISLSKNNLILLDEFRDLHDGDSTMLQVAQVYDQYEQRKSKKMLYDFDDLLLNVQAILNNEPVIRDKYQEIYRHILVDEFQDTNPAQMEVLKLLLADSTEESSCWVCGDDWQSIYAFNGASVSNILNFRDIYPQTETFILNINYRSTPQIIEACQTLIQFNTRKIDKQVQAHNTDGDVVITLDCSSEEDEALQIVNEIRDLVGRKGYQYSDMAVLYRANYLSRTIEEIFSQYKIPYAIENGMNFYQRREVKWLLDYMRVISAPDSCEADEALRCIINIPNRYIGKKFVQELEQYASEQGIHWYEALKAITIDAPYLRRNVRELVRLLDPLVTESEFIEPSELIQILRDVLDYDRFVADDEIPSPDDAKIDNLNQLKLSAAKFDDVKSFLQYTETFQDKTVGSDQEGVQLMSIHKSKGMEFPVVFVIGLIQGILPSHRDGDIEEERRICFVGISRAMQLLYLSTCQIHLGQPAVKSVFMDEIVGKQANCHTSSRQD